MARTKAVPTTTSRLVPKGNAASSNAVGGQRGQQLARPRPHHAEHGIRAGDVDDADARIGRDVAADPVEVAHGRRGAADDEELRRPVRVTVRSAS